MATPMSRKESFCKEDGSDKIDESYSRSMVGCLMYLTTTMPYILFVVRILSQFMHCIGKMHLKPTKRVIRYIKGIVGFGVNLRNVKTSCS